MNKDFLLENIHNITYILSTNQYISSLMFYYILSLSKRRFKLKISNNFQLWAKTSLTKLHDRVLIMLLRKEKPLSFTSESFEQQ